MSIFFSQAFYKRAFFYIKWFLFINKSYLTGKVLEVSALNSFNDNRKALMNQVPDKPAEKKEEKDDKKLTLALAALGAITLGTIALALTKGTVIPTKTEASLTNAAFDVSEKAKNTLADLYEQTAAAAKKSGNQKRENIYIDFASRVRNNEFSDDDIFKKLFDILYRDARLANYPIDSRHNINIDKITGADTQFIRVKNENGWFYRIPKIYHGSKVTDRVSINANADENLIKALDALFANGEIKGYYKTPDLAANWLERHDPITIYLQESATAEVLEKIKNAAQGFIRSSDDVLLGDKFAAGFALQKSPDVQDIEKALERAKKISPSFESAMRKMFASQNKAQLNASAGQMCVLEKMLAMFQS